MVWPSGSQAMGETQGDKCLFRVIMRVRKSSSRASGPLCPGEGNHGMRRSNGRAQVGKVQGMAGAETFLHVWATLREEASLFGCL